MLSPKPFLFGVLVCATSGCSSADFSAGEIPTTDTSLGTPDANDEARADSASVDSSLKDSGDLDSTIAEDTTVLDTSLTDSAAGDSLLDVGADTGEDLGSDTATDSGAIDTADTLVADTAADTNPLDSAPDTFIVDSGVDTGADSRVDTGVDVGVDTGVVDVGCLSPATCPAASECQVATCSSGICGLSDRSAGTPCAAGKCNGAGKCVGCLAPSDCGVSTECKTYTCVSNVCNVTFPTRCSGGGYCDPATRCVACLNASHCPATPDQCKMGVCTATGTCGIAPKPRGALCNGGADQCDGAGLCIECVDNGGCGECCVCSGNKCIPA